jgi:hypothetical protein
MNVWGLIGLQAAIAACFGALLTSWGWALVLFLMPAPFNLAVGIGASLIHLL